MEPDQLDESTHLPQTPASHSMQPPSSARLCSKRFPSTTDTRTDICLIAENRSFKGEFSRQASTAEIGAMRMNVIFFNRFHLHWKSRCNFTLYMGQCFFFVDRLGFSLFPRSTPNWQRVRDKNCSCVHQQKIHFLGTNPPTRSRKCVDICPKQTATCTMSNQNKSVHADWSQEIQQPQTNIQQPKTSVFGDKPKTEFKKLVETWRP